MADLKSESNELVLDLILGVIPRNFLNFFYPIKKNIQNILSTSNIKLWKIDRRKYI